jgi:hypothetical protein
VLLCVAVDDTSQLHRGRFGSRRNRFLQVRCRSAACAPLPGTYSPAHSASLLVRFDGSMTQQKREEIIKSFSTPFNKKAKHKKGDKGPPTVMLISLKVRPLSLCRLRRYADNRCSSLQAGALGLNLTCASQVFLMDP